MTAERGSPGVAMAIGGAEDKLRDRVILERFIQLAGGSGARVAIVATASSLGEEATELYRTLFQREGAGVVTGLRPTSREEANDPALADEIHRASAVFMTGGNQLRLSSIVGGTRVGNAIVEAHRRGAVVAGTSAGASALSTHMVAFGSSGATPKHRMVQLASGLGVVSGVVIDQHFEQRNRHGRLLAAVAQSPGLLGIGVDENTAAVFDGDVLEVIGRGAVTIVDGGDMLTDAFVPKGHRPMLVSGAVVHSLPFGCRFDLTSRRVVPLREVSHAPPPERAGGLVRRIAAEGADDRAPSKSARRRQRREELPEASE